MTDPYLDKRVRLLEREVSLLRTQVRHLHAYLNAPTGLPAEEPGPEATEPDGPETTKPELESLLPRTPSTPPTAPLRAPAEPSPLRPPVRYTPEPGPSLERRIGGQVFAVVGALIVIVGLALAVKVAIDYGWFRLVPPELRCVGIALGGCAFLGAGEFLRKRVLAVAVAGCNAAGVGALYVAAYATYGFFHLLPPLVAFPLMAAAAAVGLGVALRHGFLSTAALSLVGAYLVPVLLAQPDASPYVLPLYLLLLSGVALSLAALRPRPFAPLRDIAWAGAGLLGGLWTLAEAPDEPWLVLAFWCAAWALHQAELLVTAARGQLRSRTGGAPDTLAAPRPRFRTRAEPVLLSVATTAGVVAIAALILQSHTSIPHWLAPAGAFAVTSALALAFGGHLRVLRDPPRTDPEVLAAAHAAQGGALLIVTVALALGGWVEVTSWLAIGVGAALAGRWIGARSLDAYGFILLGIASIRLVTYDLFAGAAAVPWQFFGGIAIAPWTILMLGAGAAWLAVALLMLVTVRDEDGNPVVAPRHGAAAVASTLAVAAWTTAPGHPETTALSLCLAWLGLSLALRAAARLQPRLRLDALAPIVAVLAIAPWLVAAGPQAWLRDISTPGAALGFWLAGAVVAALLAHAIALARWAASDGMRANWALLATLAAAVAFVATSMEIARSAALLAHDVTARRAAISIWWGLWGVSMVILGFWWRAGPVRYVGLALMAVAAAKTVVLDLAGVPPLWRVASFVGLGALMLGVAVLYGRVSSALDDSGP